MTGELVTVTTSHLSQFNVRRSGNRRLNPSVGCGKGSDIGSGSGSRILMPHAAVFFGRVRLRRIASIHQFPTDGALPIYLTRVFTKNY